MSDNYIPNKDAALLSWSANYSTRISASPTLYGLVAGQATTYAALHSAFSSAYATAITPATRTKAAVTAKNSARAALKANARLLARIIQATATVTPAQKVELGLNPRDVVPTPVNPPTEAPIVEIVSTFGRSMKLRMHSVDSERRGKPIGVDGCYIYSFIGSAPPSDIAAWHFDGASTRTTFDLEFSSTVPAGSQVWIIAQWFSPRNQTGPACTPITAYIAGGVAEAA